MPLTRTTGLAGLAAGIGVAALLMLPRPGPAPAIVVTSDTPVFCDQLSGKLQDLIRIAHRPPQAEVLSLSAEGRQMCQTGEIRGGILRLRRGVKLMMQALNERGEP